MVSLRSASAERSSTSLDGAGKEVDDAGQAGEQEKRSSPLLTSPNVTFTFVSI